MSSHAKGDCPADQGSGRGCEKCAERGKSRFDMPFTLAFQPIFDLATGSIFAYEALARAPGGGSAAEVFKAVTPENQYAFDQESRIRAIERASALGITDAISINFMPNAVYDPRTCLSKTLWTAERFDFPLSRIVFEFTESEEIRSVDHLKKIITEYRRCGLRTAIDDFGAGFAGLGLLADLQPDIVKLDMHLIRGIDTHAPRQRIVESITRLCLDLGILPVAEGIETPGELDFLTDAGITRIQGFLIGRPRLEDLDGPDRILARIQDLRRAAA